jgi:hypothetical protein
MPDPLADPPSPGPAPDPAPQIPPIKVDVRVTSPDDTVQTIALEFRVAPATVFVGELSATNPSGFEAVSTGTARDLLPAVVRAMNPARPNRPVSAAQAVETPYETKDLTARTDSAVRPSIRFLISGTPYTATVPDSPSADLWLSGPLVTESRYVLAPVDPDGTSHPFLRVIFDVRSYRDGGRRLDVTVENCLNKVGAGPLDYYVEIVAGDSFLFIRLAVHHPWLARYRMTFPLNSLAESTVTHDFAPAISAGALPHYRPDPAPPAYPYAVTTPAFDVLGVGGIFFPMAGPGGRPDIAPYPDWTARFLATQDGAARAYMLACGDHAGTFWGHFREPEDGPYKGLGADRLISIQERPSFLAYTFGKAGQIPLGKQDATPDLRPNAAHAPSLAYVPYLVTGDRYYADEMKFWANHHLLANWGAADLPRGSSGLIVGNSTGRAIAWSLRDLADAAAYLPDDDPAKPYFARAVKANLEYLDRHAETKVGPLGMAWVGPMGASNSRKDVAGAHVWVQPWQQTFLAWAVHHANGQGFPGGERWKRQAVAFHLRLFTSTAEGYPREYAGPDSIAIGDWSAPGTGGVKTVARLYEGLGEVFAASNRAGVDKATPFDGFYGLDAHLALLMAVEMEMPGAEEVMAWLGPQVSEYLRRRAGWNLESV